MEQDQEHFWRARIGAILGNTIEYYDQSIYGYLAPFLAPVFFPTEDPFVGLLLTYLLLPIGIISRPIGAYLIGNIGDYTGRKKALLISITGMGVATFAIGCLPTYNNVGLLSPCLLVLCRIIQSFFVGAEFNGGAIYSLEHTPSNRRGVISGFYSAGAVMGMLVASLVGWVVALYPLLTWRFPFCISFIGAFVAFYMRFFMKDVLQDKRQGGKKVAFVELVFQYRLAFIRLICVAGFFNAIYTVPMVFLNAYVPIISSLSIKNMLLLSCYGLCIYMGSLVFFGYLSDKWNVLKIMKVSSVSIIALSYPLFLLLCNTSLFKIFIFKGIFAVLAGAFNGVFHAWSLNIFKYNHRYRGVSLGYSLGSQLIGNSAPAICLWMWHETHYIPAPALYIMICGITSFFCIFNPLKVKN